MPWKFKFSKAVSRGEEDPETCDWSRFSRYLDTADIPDIVRLTKNHHMCSGNKARTLHGYEEHCSVDSTATARKGIMDLE